MQLDDPRSQREKLRQKANNFLQFFKKQSILFSLFLVMILFAGLYLVFRQSPGSNEGGRVSSSSLRSTSETSNALSNDQGRGWGEDSILGDRGEKSLAYPALGTAQSDLFDHYYRYAYDTYKRGDLDKAESYLSEAGRESLSRRQYYQYSILHTTLLWGKGEYAGAKEVLLELHKAGTENETAFSHLFLGMLESALGNEAELIHHYTRSGELGQADDNRGYEKLADYYFQTGQYREALLLYKNLANLQLPLSMMKIAIMNLFLDDVGESEKALAQLTLAERSRHLDQVYFIEALGHLKRQNYDEANEFFARAAQTANGDRELHYLRYWAETAFSYGRYHQARQLYHEVLSSLAERGAPLPNAPVSDSFQAIFLPGSLSPLVTLKALGDAYYMSGEYNNSRIFYQRYIRLLAAEGGQSTEAGRSWVFSSETLEALYFLAVSHYYTGDPQASLAILDQLTKNYDLSAQMLRSTDYLKAQLYVEQKEMARARRALATFVETWGRHPEVVYTLLELEIELDQQSFLEKYRELSATYAEDDRFKLILAKYFEGVGDYADVISLLKRYGASSSQLDRKIADLYLKAKEYDAAIDYYLRASERTSDKIDLAEILNNQAFAYAQLGNVSLAQDLLASAAEEHERRMPFFYNLALIEKKRANNSLYEKYLYQARLEAEAEDDPRLTAMVYFHSGLASIRTYQLSRARGYIKLAYELDPANPKIAQLHNGKLLELFQ